MPKRDVIVLGINDGHDAGAALVKNGKVVAAVQEERMNNIKHFQGIPERSIEEVFRISRILPSEINLIALVSFNRVFSIDKPDSTKIKIFERLSPFLHSDQFVKFYVNYLKKYRTFEPFKKIFEKLGLLQTETTIIEHQMAHAAVAYRSAPFGYDKDILILTADGAGDGLSSTVNVGRKGNIERIAFSSYYDSLGNSFYSEITRFLGLKPWDHEYKVMGLAPYGKADYCIDQIRKIVRIDPQNPLRFQNTIGATTLRTQPKLRKLLINQRFDNIAAAAQQHFEELMKQWVANATRTTGINKIVCAGGLFLNVKANKLLREMDGVDEIFFYPSPGDDGTPVGAALQGYHDYCIREGLEPVHIEIGETYYGSSYSNDEIEKILKNGKWKYSYYENIDGIASDLLVKGKILARCSGRFEWGPRALGNRSIIADPRNMMVIHKINFAIKQRDFWMPFAPSIIEERMEDYLVDPEFAPYMIMAFDSTERGNEIPATIHPFDKTCRPQTVKRSWNSSYHNIIKNFENQTGVGVILNTSFNLHGYPIVGNPEIALWTLDNSKLDGLILENYLVTKE